VDFYVPQAQLAIQVCYSLNDIETRTREINALMKMAQRVEVKKMLIITKEEEESVVQKGWSIEAIPVTKWLMR
jgi:predicted AAA+ superfamily ATPase